MYMLKSSFENKTTTYYLKGIDVNAIIKLGNKFSLIV